MTFHTFYLPTYEFYFLWDLIRRLHFSLKQEYFVFLFEPIGNFYNKNDFMEKETSYNSRLLKTCVMHAFNAINYGM